MRLLNNRLLALTVDEEQAEVLAVLNGNITKGESMPDTTTVQLKRTFNQKTYNSNLKVTGEIKFWRIISPATHPNFNSDLSLDGLKVWGIVK